MIFVSLKVIVFILVFRHLFSSWCPMRYLWTLGRPADYRISRSSATKPIVSHTILNLSPSSHSVRVPASQLSPSVCSPSSRLPNTRSRCPRPCPPNPRARTEPRTASRASTRAPSPRPNRPRPASSSSSSSSSPRPLPRAASPSPPPRVRRCRCPQSRTCPRPPP